MAPARTRQPGPGRSLRPSTRPRPSLESGRYRAVYFDGTGAAATPQAELDPSSFWPIHRSTIVNTSAIAGVTRDLGGRVSVRLKSRSERLPVSEAHEHRFRRM